MFSMTTSEGTITDLQARLDLSLLAERFRPRLRWTDANGAHSQVLEGRVLVGSSAHVAVSIADRAVSRLHAEIELASDGVWIRDLGSRNGTWIDGTLVKHARIPLGGSVRVGATTMDLSKDAEATQIPLWPHDRFGPLVARSESMRELFIHLAQYAESDTAVLLQGETGTGKELAAEAIHEVSARAGGPFIIVDCGALPETLLDTELFGHARGAFTGAVAARMGAIEAANGGTVFLDEVGELPLSMQSKLLRAIESLTVRRIGESEHRKVNVRFISATHRDLQAMVARGAFREDLFFRLSVLPAFIPPLRTRPDDIPLLLQHFLRDVPSLRIPPELLREISLHVWPGNARELRNFSIRARAVGPELAWAMTRGGDGPPSSIPRPSAIGRELASSPGGEGPFKVLRERLIDQFEREYIEKLLAKHGRNVGLIADEAELDRSYVHRLLRKHDL